MSNLSDLKPGIWNVDASHSEVGFTARHLMVSKVRGQFKTSPRSSRLPSRSRSRPSRPPCRWPRSTPTAQTATCT